MECKEDPDTGEPGDPYLDIATVDAMQGNEADVVIVSCVRSNDDGKLGFLTVANRVNVALSRAKRQLIVVGDRSTLTKHPGIWFDMCLEHNWNVVHVSRWWIELKRHHAFLRARLQPGQVRILKRALQAT